MFGRSIFREFEEDPFFSGMGMGQRPMGGFNDPFMMDPFGMAGNPRLGIPDGRRQADEARQPGNEMMTPFGNHGNHFGMFGPMGSMMQGMMGMNGMMGNMHQHFGQMENDPNVHSYSSQSVYSYSNNGQGQPKVYQATTETKKAPGGIKETRQALRDSETGTDKMAIGHHIHERGHVVERSRNRRTGEEERKQDFIHIDESEADHFNTEWEQKTRRVQDGRQLEPRRGMLRAIEPRPYDRHKQDKNRDKPRKDLDVSGKKVRLNNHSTERYEKHDV